MGAKATTRVYSVDAFTGDNAKGNLAGVCLPPPATPDVDLQRIATSFGAPETAFIFQNERDFHIRWFTPQQEVDLCGHATLAAAAWIWNMGLDSTDSLVFLSKSGQLVCRRSSQEIIEMDFPKLPPTKCQPEVGLLEALSIRNHLFVGRSKDYFLIGVRNQAEIRDIRPDFVLLKQLGCMGVFVTAISENPSYDFVSRCFFPKEGIPEDPVTGSAHCSLGPYWGQRLSKKQFTAFQASSRGGEIQIRLEESIVVLGGRARCRNELLCAKRPLIDSKKGRQ